MADIKNEEKVTELTTFHAFSVTKTFTALAILQLVERGKLNLDDTASQYLPDFPYPSNITVRQLLTHSSGVPNPLPLRWIHLISEHKMFDYKEFFNGIFQKHPKIKSNPNEKFAYSNLGYVLLGMLIEELSGQSYSDYINENIIRKIGINSDHLDFTIPDAMLKSKGYQKRWSLMNFLLEFLFDKSKYMGETEGKWRSFKSYYLNGAAYGGLIGSGNAFVTYVQELLNHGCRLISEESKHQLFTENITETGKHTNMCLSWFKGELNNKTYFAHAGGGGGGYCEIRLYPEPGKGSVIMFNRSGMTDERFLDKIDTFFFA